MINEIKKYKFFVFLNLFILLAYLISASLSYSEIILNVKNNNYDFYLNRKLIEKITDNSFTSSGITIEPNFINLPFDLPIKPKVLSLKVQDTDGHSILFDQNNVSTTGIQSWKNYRATIKIYGVPNLSVIVNDQNNGDGLYLVLRTFFDRDYGVKKIVNGQETLLTSHTFVDMGIIPTIMLLLNLVLQAYPFCLFFIILHLVINRLNFFRKINFPRNLKHFYSPISLLVIGTILVGTFFLLIYINKHLLEGIPHVPDSVIYMMQGKIFASGRLFASPQIFERHYEFFDSLKGGMIYRDNKWFSQYPFGHPLMLSIGILLNKTWLIPPIIALFSLIFIFLIAKKNYGRTVAIFIIFIAAMSPFFQSNGADFMSHNTAFFYLTGFIFFLFRTTDHKSIINPIIASIFFGLLFNTRILTAVGVFIPTFIFCLINKKIWPRYLFLIPGIVIFLLLYFGYNLALTGNPFTNPYQLTITSPLGFYAEHPLGSALIDALTNLAYFLTFSFGWPQKLTLLFLMIALVLPPFKKVDLLFFSIIISQIFAWLLFNGHYIMYGPRYYYEILPFSLLLTGAGIYKLIKISNYKGIAYLLNLSLIIYLTYNLANGWVLNKMNLWDFPDTPSNLKALKNFNSVNGNLLKTVRKQNIHNALIFITPCEHWYCDGLPVSLNNPNFDGDIIWAKDLKEKNFQLITALPNRKYYIADYFSASIKPF